jgi:gamma-glutamyltranspeptidase/glutathione hydrolase
MSRIFAACLALLLAACALAPEVRPPAKSAKLGPAAQMATTANPLATRAALEMLDKGGSPIDAAIAAQMVLGLVEAQSSGIGGGTLVMYWDAAHKRLTSYDGLASAPVRATASLRTDTDGKLLDAASSQRGGRTVGVPGTLAVLKMVHERYGKLAWQVLFEPAITLAEDGFPLAPYMHAILSADDAAANHPEMVPLYFGTDGKVLPIGTLIRNPEYAGTLRRIAKFGAGGWLGGGHAEEMVSAAQRGFRPTLMTAKDLYGYRAVEREPVCAPFLVYTVCTMAPPSFGGLYVLQVMQMVELNARGRFDFDDPAFVHLYVEAGRLAQADRRHYVGDPDFVNVPVRELASIDYAHLRAAQIDRTKANPEPKPGVPVTMTASRAADTSTPLAMTSQIAIADRAGNALSITTTINLNFGSRLMVGGYVLNNALTNFSAAPKPGETIANQMAPGKRPVTSMAPTIVFGGDGLPVVVGGSAGGGPIVDYIAASLIEMLANGRTPAEALARGHITTATQGKVQLEKGTAAAALAAPLRALGHNVEETTLLSGLGFLKREGDGWIGAADPRRDGAALGSATDTR